MFMCFVPRISFWATKFRNNLDKDLCIRISPQNYFKNKILETTKYPILGEGKPV